MNDGMAGIALTDHGAMYGIKEFVNYIKSAKSKIQNEIKRLTKELESDPGNRKLQEELAAKRARHDFKPIIGCECYCARRSRFLQSEKIDSSGWHLVVLAKNLTGYKNLIKMVSKSWTEGFYYRPRIDKELLEQYHEGLIISTLAWGEIRERSMTETWREQKRRYSGSSVFSATISTLRSNATKPTVRMPTAPPIRNKSG